MAFPPGPVPILPIQSIVFMSVIVSDFSFCLAMLDKRLRFQLTNCVQLLFGIYRLMRGSVQPDQGDARQAGIK